MVSKEGKPRTIIVNWQPPSEANGKITGGHEGPALPASAGLTLTVHFCTSSCTQAELTALGNEVEAEVQLKV